MTITIEIWDFSLMRVSSAYTADNQEKTVQAISKSRILGISGIWSISTLKQTQGSDL